MNRNRGTAFWAQISITVVMSANLGIHAYLGSYSRFMADDYCSAAEVGRLGILRAAWYWYVSWTGRFSANLLDAIFGGLGPDVTPAITSFILLAWCGALVALIRHFWRFEDKGASLLLSTSLSTSILALTLALTPNIGQSLYWGQGMRSVVPPLILGTLYASLLAWFLDQKLVRSKFAMIFLPGFVLIFIAGGFSETFAVLQFIALLLVTGILWRSRSNVLTAHSLQFTVVGLLGASLALLTIIAAPGNPYRQAFYPPPPALVQLAKIALGSFVWYLSGLFNSTTAILGIAAALLTGIAFSALKGSRLVQMPTPRMVLAIGLGLVFSCFPPSAYGLSDAPPERTLIIPTYVLILTLVAAGVSMGQTYSSLRQHTAAIVVASTLLVMAVGAISGYRQVARTNTFVRYADAWESFDSNMIQLRKQGLTSAEITTLELNMNNWAGLNVLGDNPRFWLNKCVSEYYGVQIISKSPQP